jgi:hypothetical protein
MAHQAYIINAEPQPHEPYSGPSPAIPFLDRLLVLPTPDLSAGGFGAPVA